MKKCVRWLRFFPVGKMCASALVRHRFKCTVFCSRTLSPVAVVCADGSTCLIFYLVI